MTAEIKGDYRPSVMRPREWELLACGYKLYHDYGYVGPGTLSTTDAYGDNNPEHYVLPSDETYHGMNSAGAGLSRRLRSRRNRR